jgi:3-oxoacyl-[acyl-carrier protein] reductase
MAFLSAERGPLRSSHWWEMGASGLSMTSPMAAEGKLDGRCVANPPDGFGQGRLKRPEAPRERWRFWEGRMGRFDGKVVVVTGSARGLGRDYARYFAADGANVVLADIRGTNAATAEAQAAGRRCVGVETDVTSPASVSAMVERARSEFGRLDILINNAGLWRGLAEAGLLNCPAELWDAAWAVNVTGPLHCYQAAAPLMIAGRWGRVINISSMASHTGSSAYGLTKHAVEHMTGGMAREMGKHGVTVNCIAPGISAFEAASGQIPRFEQIVAGNAVARVGTSRDLYEAMAYLCGSEASWVTGQTLRVDGGALAR